MMACMLPRTARGVRVLGRSVTPGSFVHASSAMQQRFTMNEAATAEAVVEAVAEDGPTEVTAPLTSKFLQEMQWRGFIHQATDIEGLDKKLASGSVTAYLGFDATASSLHVGSLLQIMLLRHFQRCGHKPIVLVGGGTTKVGDPSGKDASRQLLTQEKIDENIAGISQVFQKFITFGDGPSDAQMVNNDDWLSSVAYLEFLREYGRFRSRHWESAVPSTSRQRPSACLVAPRAPASPTHPTRAELASWPWPRELASARAQDAEAPRAPRRYFTINRMLSFESVKQRLARESPFSFLEFKSKTVNSF